FLWCLKIERSEFKGNKILFIRKLNWLMTGKINMQWFIEHLKTGHCHLWGNGIWLHVLRVEEIEAVDSTNVHDPIAGTEVGIRIEFVALQSIRRVIRGERFRAR